MALLKANDTTGDQDLAFDYQLPSSKNALIVFTRNPELGKCKTRLAATIGDENALEIYKLLLKHTADFSAQVNADRYVFYSEKIRENDLWDVTIFRKKLQKGRDLGERMHNAFAEIFELGYEKVIIVGSDIYTLNAQDVEAAFIAMQNKDFVVGPAEDGGYYLLGMKNLKAELFNNKKWGTDTVLEETLKNLKNDKVTKLPIKNDIDVIEDIEGIAIFQKFISKSNPSN